MDESKKVVLNRDVPLRKAHTMVNGLNSDKADLMKKVKIYEAVAGSTRDKLKKLKAKLKDSLFVEQTFKKLLDFDEFLKAFDFDEFLKAFFDSGMRVA